MTHHFSLFAFNDWMRAYRECLSDGRSVTLLSRDYSVQH